MICIGCLLGLQKCAGPDHSERLEKVDSLQHQLGQLRESFWELDTSGALELYQKVRKRQELFETHFESDSMGEELFRTLDSYKHTRKAFEGYRRSLRSLRMEFTKCEEQLKDLRSDLEKGVLGADDAAEYIEDESSALHRLKGELEKLEMKTKAGFRNFEERPADLSEHLELPDTVEWPAIEKQ